MSFPSQTPPPHSYMSQPSEGGISPRYWPPYLTGNEQNQPQPNYTSQQFDPPPPPPFKRAKTFENPQNFASFTPQNPRFNPTNGQGNKGTSHIFYKTRICAKFMEGTCRNGEHCTFAHGHEDLREPPRNWQELIREKDRGIGSGSWGDDQRMIHRMKICKKYYNGEECPYGDKCNFLHERPPAPLHPMKKFKVDMPEQRDSSAIIIGDARGSNSDFDQAAFWKTKLCSKWEMGQCPYGERCHFAHGQSELRLSGTVNEPEPATTSGSIPRMPVSVSVTTAPASVVVGAPLNRDEQQKEALKWKLTKKINRIYGDWLDDLDSPDNDEI